MQFIEKQPNEEINSKYKSLKDQIFLEMEIIKERIKDQEIAGINWNDVGTMRSLLVELRDLKELVKPF